METALKESLLAILAARAYIYSLFHKCMGTEPTGELMDVVSSAEAAGIIGLLAEDGQDFAGSFTAFLAHYKALGEADIARLKSEYTALYVGPFRLIAPPWESVYTSVNRTLFTCTTADVRGWYKRYGYLPEGYPHVAEDHIAYMMNFMGLLCERCAALVEQGDTAQAEKVLRDQRLFMKQHLLSPWCARYAEDLQKSQTLYFYPVLARHMLAFLQYDHEIIDECLIALS